MSTIAPTFTASGLASGMDTNALVDSLVKLESRPVDLAKARQTAFNTQISALGDLTTKLTALTDSIKALTANGVLGVVQVGTASGFTATPSSATTAGRYAVQVDALASAAKARSTGFTTGTLVNGGTLSLGVNGTNYDIPIVDGSSLEMVATSINTAGAPVTAAVLESNGSKYLSVTNKDTGFTVGQPAASALTITQTVTGTAGQSLGLAVTQPATNAKVTVDGLQFERATNLVADAIGGTTLTLTKITTAPEDLVMSADKTSTQANLQKFVTSYNSLLTGIRSHLMADKTVDRATTLAGDSSLRSMQQSLQSMISGVLNAGSTVRTLADVGIRTGSTGALYIDDAKLTSALGTDARAVNALFQTATTGLGATALALQKNYTDAIDGIWTQHTKSLNTSVKSLDGTITKLQDRVDSYKKILIAQFTAMETVVGNFKNIGNYLTQQDNAKKTSS